MNPDPADPKFRELAWRRPETPAEQAELQRWLATHPEAAAEFQEEQALNDLLEKLPNAPVASNFTTRVMAEIARSAPATPHPPTVRISNWWRRLVPRIAIAAVVVGGGMLTWHQYQTSQQSELVSAVRNLVSNTEAAPLANPAVLQDFEAIRQLGQADEGLLALGQDLDSLNR